MTDTQPKDEQIERLRKLHEDARGAAFDLCPADGPIARLALFMHESGDKLLATIAAAEAREAEKDAALRTAIRHIEHMAAWITANNKGYSFEAIGEDMPTILTALGEQP